MLFQVGTFVFGDDDLPETLTIGRTLKNTVIRLSDGSRFLQEFGAETDDITFQGTFRYGNAVSRAQTLDQIYLARAPIQFACDYYTTTVVITSYKYTIHWQSEVDYNLTLYVADDLPYTLQDTRAANVYSTLGAAQTATAPLVNVPGLSSQQLALQTTIQGTGLHS